MKSIYLPTIINTAILSVTTFIVSLFLFATLNVPYWLKIFISCLFTLTLGGMCFQLTRKKRLKAASIKHNAASIKLFRETLNLLPPQKQREIFTEYLKKTGSEYKSKNGYFFVNGFSVYPCFLLDDITFNEAKKILDDSPYKANKTVIISNGFSENLLKYREALPMILIPSEDFIAELNKYGLIKETKPVKVKKQTIFIKLFKKANGLKFILYGITMIILSFIVFYPIYYLISGTIFTVFGLIAAFFGKLEPKNPVTKNIDEIFSFNIKNDNA